MEKFGQRVRVSVIRPFADLTRLMVADALERAGARVVRVFDAPDEFDLLRAYMRGEGIVDGLVIPYDPVSNTEGITLVARYHRAAGAPRRVLVPVRRASVDDVRGAIAASLSPEALARVLVLDVEDLASGSADTRHAAHWWHGRLRELRSTGPAA